MRTLKEIRALAKQLKSQGSLYGDWLKQLADKKRVSWPAMGGDDLEDLLVIHKIPFRTEPYTGPVKAIKFKCDIILDL